MLGSNKADLKLQCTAMNIDRRVFFTVCRWAEQKDLKQIVNGQASSDVIAVLSIRINGSFTKAPDGKGGILMEACG